MGCLTYNGPSRRHDHWMKLNHGHYIIIRKLVECQMSSVKCPSGISV